ncbi:MAG: hypothetical protein JXB24_14295 [Bacteroidales bacterium]|nr:hypothetical protein [Bacteroidales bacterium]
MIRAFLLFSMIILLVSCGEKGNQGIYDQGRLEYKIKYLNAEEANYDPSFLPKKMVLDFNQEFSINNIDGFMGFFKLGNMTSFKNHKVNTHLKVLDKNYAFFGGRNDMMCCFDCMDGMKLEEDTATVIIAGLKSKKVTVSFKDSDESFDIYYTNDINLNKPNITNPYHSIDGVLTQFRLVMGPYLMLFTATKFDPKYLPKEKMKIPEQATIVNRPEMVAILNRLMIQNQ